MTSAMQGLLVKCALEPTGNDRHSTAVPGQREAKNRHPGSTPPRPGVSAPRASGPSPNVLGILCAFAAIALYLPALPYGWVWDDRLLVISKGAGGVGAEGFRLLTSLLFRLEWVLGYGSPPFAHMISIFLHGLATWVFFRIAVHVGGPTSIAVPAGSADAVSGIDAAARGWAAPMAFLEYLKMLIYPHHLNALRTLHAPEVASWTERLAPFAALAGIALIVAWRRRDPVARTGALL